MKKSEIYKQTQLSVMRDERFTEEDKLEIIRELQEREFIAELLEGREAADNGEV